MLKRWWLFPLLAAPGLIIGVFVAAVITYLQPKTFDSVATVEIKQEGAILTPFGSEPKWRDPGFLDKEMVRLKSRKLLLEAAREGDFSAKWLVDAEKAAGILDRSLTVTQLRGTELVSIRGRHVNREDARDMVRVLVKVYSDQKKSTEGADTAKALGELGKAVKEHEARVEESRKALSAEVRTQGQNLTEDYVTKKRAFESGLELLQTLKLKFVTERANARMNEDSLVVHENPELAMAPSGPDVAKNMVYGMSAGVLVSQVIALLLAMMLERRSSGVTPAGHASLRQ